MRSLFLSPRFVIIECDRNKSPYISIALFVASFILYTNTYIYICVCVFLFHILPDISWLAKLLIPRLLIPLDPIFHHSLSSVSIILPITSKLVHRITDHKCVPDISPLYQMRINYSILADILDII